MQKYKLQISQSGFTLVELAFVVMIWGGIMAALFSMYSEYRNRIVLIETADRLQLNAEAVTSFQTSPKRYPCPSEPGLQVGDPNYGRERCGVAAGLALGACTANGLCRVPAARDVDNDPLTVDSVYIGGIPFMSMQEQAELQSISRENAAKRRAIFDGWGGSFTYAVSANLTNETTYDSNHGGISVVTEWGDSVVQPVGSADFVIVSHGENGRGAYTQQHVMGPPCAGVGNEIDNCLHDDAQFVNSLIYKNEGANFYDDYVYVYQAAVDGIWESSGVQDMYYKGAGYLGIGTGMDVPAERLEVRGRSYTDRVRSRGMCDTTGADCFMARLIGGTLTRDGTGAVERDITGISEGGMGCDDSDHIAYGIENNRLDCGASGFNMDAGRNVSCGAGFFLRGFNTDGSPICEASLGGP